MKSIRFGLIVIAICGLIVLAAGIRVAIWTKTADALAGQQKSIGSQLLVLRKTNEALVELESGQRGYLLTGDAADLTAYETARRDLAAALKGLGEAFGDNLAEVAKLAHAEEDDAARTVQLRREGRPAAALETAIADQGGHLREAVGSRLHAVADQLHLALSDLDGLQRQTFWKIYGLSGLVVLIVDLLVVVAIVSLSISIQRVREQQRERAHQAMHDALTGLPNRRYLGEWLTMSLAAARRHGRPLVLLYVDLDGFKSINDQFGHEAGDRVLQVTASRLRRALRMSDFFARPGGDEFVAILPEAPTEPNLSVLIERLQAAIVKAPIAEVGDGAVRASIGAAWFPADGDTVDALLAAADHAMYQVKERHRTSESRPLEPSESEHGGVRSIAT